MRTLLWVVSTGHIDALTLCQFDLGLSITVTPIASPYRYEIDRFVKVAQGYMALSPSDFPTLALTPVAHALERRTSDGARILEA